jgi:hypothetical protein
LHLRSGRSAQRRIVFVSIGLIQDLKSAFGVRRLVAALESVFWPRNGSLLPFSGETNAWFQAQHGNPGSKLPVWSSTKLLKAATRRRTPNVPLAPCVKNYAALGGPRALQKTLTSSYAVPQDSTRRDCGHLKNGMRIRSTFRGGMLTRAAPAHIAKDPTEGDLDEKDRFYRIGNHGQANGPKSAQSGP